MELIDDDDIELCRVKLLDVPVDRLDRREDVIPCEWPLATDEALTERLVVEHQPKDLLALLEDLVAVGNE